MNIKSYKIDTEYFISELENFEDFKTKLFDIVKKYNPQPVKNDYETLTFSDWNIPYEAKPYNNLAKKYLTPFLEKMADKIDCKFFDVHEIWYQEYSKNDFHEWHNHIGCMYSNVLFLELEKDSHATQLYDQVNKKIINVPNLKPGNIISFPGNIIHRSPELDSGKKSIMSFNVSYWDIDRKRLDTYV